MEIRAAAIVIFLSLLVLFGCSSKATKEGDRAVAEDTSSEQIDDEPFDSDIQKDRWVCSGIQEKRVIEKLPTDEGGCKVLYTKYGKTQEKARAKANPSICDNILVKIKGNLDRIGFVCR